MLGCGYNHSIAITNDGGVKVWGSSKNNELGVVDLYGFEQLKPFDLITRIDDIEYKATQVACGESHSLILVQDKNQLPLKLVYSGEIDLNYFFQIIIQYIQDYYQSFEQYHAQQQKEEFSREDVWTLIRDAIPPSHHDIVNTLVDILLEHSHKGSDKIDYKELRDQLYGKRLDSGRVLQWLHPLDVGEEIQDKDKLKPKKVEFPVAEIVTMVACGSSHCMAVAGAKQLYTWGLNSHGQLGLGDTVNRVEPVKITSIPGEGIMDVGGGSAHSAVLLANGMIYTWGLGANGRLGHGSENSKLEPTKLEIRDIVSLAVGHSHTGAVANTQVFTWGNGSYGRLGHGNQDDQMLPTPIVEFAGKSVRKLVFSVFHSMAIICNGEVWGWGNANDGRLGVDAGNEEKQLIPRKVGTGTALSGYDIIDVALGLKHAIAVANNGGMFAWGDTEAGKLGLGAVGVSKIMVPVKIPEINLGQGIIKEHKQRNMPILSTSIYNIQCGDYNTFVLTDSGELLVTGGNDKGQLGVEVEPAEMDDDEPEQLENGHMDYEYEPLKVQSVKRGKDAYKFMFIKPSNYGNVDRISNISLAGQSMFAISTSGSVYAWGNNGDGQLGIGYQSENFQEIPITIKSLSRLRASKVACGPHHTAFVMASGEVFVCGNSEDGKLGIGPSILEMSDHSQYLPRMLSSVPIISKISCGYTHTAAIDLNGGVWVWGSGWSGKLGTGNTETYYEPYNVKLESFAPDPSGKLVKIACGEDHTVVVTSDGFVYSAGIAKYAGHRRSNMNISIRYFTLISDVEEKISKIAVGRNHSIAITVSGNTYGWGETRYSKLGAGPFKEDPDDKDITYPTILHTGTALITKASCGPNHTACIASDGAIVVWGSTLKGRLGIGEPYKKSKKEESRSDKKITEVPVPLVLAGLQRWLLENKKKIKKEVSAPSAQDEKYVLQGLLENEGANQKHETLLSDLTKLKTQLINILDQYKELYDIEVKK